MAVKRITAVDALRGFSLFGILMANLLIFQYGMDWRDTLKDLSGLDQVSYYSIRILIEGSFMPIFTLLFGFSLIKMIESIRSKGTKSRWAIIRRAIGLIILGFLHSSFIWGGDILLPYGTMIFCLLIFINRKPKTLIIWASLFFVINCGLEFSTPTEKSEFVAYNNKQETVYSKDSYAETTDFSLNAGISEIADNSYILIISVLISSMLGSSYFLIGMAFAKWRLFENLEEERKIYRWAFMLVLVGLILKVIGQFSHLLEGISLIAGQQLLSLGHVFLLIGYVFLFMWLFPLIQSSKIICAFENVGKLSLTNYLMQSVICTFVFNDYGLGLSGKLGVTFGIIFGLIVYIIQCYVSTIYLKTFKRGPVETLLRIWTNFSWNGQVQTKN